MRMTRASMLEVVRQDYVRTARAKGLPNGIVLLRHALRNALNPVVSLVGLELAVLLGGTVIVETIFGWPGLSSLLLAGVRSRDYPTVQGVVLVIAILTILINLAIDLVYGLLDPRIRYS
jgi:ABC-type dipeptide/oligopeptide/nickel transport system permease component